MLKSPVKHLLGEEFTELTGIDHTDNIAYSLLCIESGVVVYGYKEQQCVCFLDTRNIGSAPITIRDEDTGLKLLSFTQLLLYPNVFNKKHYEILSRIKCTDEEFLKQYALEFNEHSEVVFTEFAADRQVIAQITMSQDSLFYTASAMGYAFKAVNGIKL